MGGPAETHIPERRRLTNSSPWHAWLTHGTNLLCHNNTWQQSKSKIH